MEYIYGFDGDIELLKTISDKHTDLSGHFTSIRETDIDKTEDYCDIVCKLKSFDNDEKFYDIYQIKNHYRIVDKTPALRASIAQQKADIDYIAMETGVNLED